MKHRIPVAASTVLSLFAIASVWAHHSPSAIFDMAKRISVTGTLTKIDWVNPHIVMEMEAKGEAGKTDHWTFESNPPSWYRSVGLARADFAKAVGQTVTVEGVRAKEIAARLDLSPKTVDTYRASLMRKLDIHDVAGLVKFAIHRDLTSH